MHLPVPAPLLPMLAKRVDAIPAGSGWIFEPKWDGFRVLVFRDGAEIHLQSRDEKPLNRYFPDLLEPLKAQLPARCVLDGEIVIAGPNGLEFDALQLRLHPAASRVKMLADQRPASIVFWDLLCEGDRDLRSTPFRQRRAELEAVLAGAAPPVHLTPVTTDARVAADWFTRFEGAGLDGVMAKAEAGVYEPNKRVMLKVKHERECDCVVAGFRWHKGGAGTAVGSLLLGLYDDDGSLHHVGVCASFTTPRRKELVDFLCDVSRERGRRTSLEGVGRQRRRCRHDDATAGGQPLESGEGPLVGAAAPRARGAGGLRSHAGLSLPPHGAVPAMAPRQERGGLHLRAARGRRAARARGDLRQRTVTSSPRLVA